MQLKLIPAIHRATHRIGLYLAELRNGELSQGEAHILAHLASASPATVGELHEALAHKRSTLTSILDRLAARGFITREPGIEDRRTFVVALTKTGQPVASRVLRHLLALERAVVDAFPPQDLNAFLMIAGRIEAEAHHRRSGRMPPLSTRTTGSGRRRSQST
jgi:DNA-binding MarR family transcriptional regulator